MTYPPSSTVSYFNQICFISNLTDWLIVDGVFFVIRCIILLSEKRIIFKLKKKLNKWYYSYCFFRSVVQSNEACIDLQIVDTSEKTTPKMHRDNNYTGLDLHVIYIEFCKKSTVEMYVRFKQYDSSP